MIRLAIAIIVALIVVAQSFGFHFAWELAWFFLYVVVIIWIIALASPLETLAKRFSFVTAFFFWSVFYVGLDFLFYTIGEIIDQPALFPWMNAFSISEIVYSSILAMLLADIGTQGQHEKDYCFLPRLGALSRLLARKNARIAMIAGVSLVAIYYVNEVASVWKGSGGYGIVWPSKRVYVVLRLLWGVFWISDAFSRDRHRTTLAAAIYLATTLVIMPFTAMPGIRE